MTTDVPEISIIIPALHEAAGINDTLSAIRRLDGSDRCEVIVADGDPAGSTIAAIDDPTIHCVLSDPGRGKQLNAGAAAACADVLLFLHADTILPAAGLARIREVMKKERYVGGSFRLAFDSDRFHYRVLATAASLRSRFTRVPFGDQGIFIRRQYFNDIGGFREFAVMEDVDLMRRIRRRGDRIHILDDCTRTSARRMEKEGAAWCLTRGLVFHCLFSIGVSPARLRRFYPICTESPSIQKPK